MGSELVGMGIFFGIIIGIGGAFLLILIKNKLQKKDVLRKIREQDTKLGANKVPLDFYREPKKEIEKKKEPIKKEPIKKVVKKKVRVKKK